MTKHTWRKEILSGKNCLVPACVDAEEWLGKTKHGQGVLIDPRRPRNYAHHKKFYAIIAVVASNWPENDDHSIISKDALVELVKLKVGLVSIVLDENGKAFTYPKSICFAAMPQEEFSVFYKDAITYMSAVLGLDAEQLTTEGDQFNPAGAS